MIHVFEICRLLAVNTHQNGPMHLVGTRQVMGRNCIPLHHLRFNLIITKHAKSGVAEARIWPRLSGVCHTLSRAAMLLSAPPWVHTGRSTKGVPPPHTETLNPAPQPTNPASRPPLKPCAYILHLHPTSSTRTPAARLSLKLQGSYVGVSQPRSWRRFPVFVNCGREVPVFLQRSQKMDF